MAAQMSTAVPTRKVYAGALAGALTTIAVYVLGMHSGSPVPPYVATAATTVLTFLISYFTPPAARDAVVGTDTPAVPAAGS